MANTPVKNYRMKKWATDQLDSLLASGYGKNQTAVIHRLIKESMEPEIQEARRITDAELKLRDQLGHANDVIDRLRFEQAKLLDEAVELKRELARTRAMDF